MADNIKKSNNTSTKDKVNETINKILHGLFVAFILAICSYLLYVIAPEIFKFVMDNVVKIVKKDYPILKLK
jgi:ABC-type bacteriocin/lantibiotic exporter with double-glycine peptidase domain